MKATEDLSKTTHIQVRVDEATKAAVKAAAKRDGRTVSNWILWVAAQHLRSR